MTVRSIILPVHRWFGLISGVILAIGGLFLWWPRKIFRVTGGGASWRRVYFDLHNVMGICSSLVLFIVTASGVFINQSSTLEGRSCRPWTHTRRRQGRDT